MSFFWLLCLFSFYFFTVFEKNAFIETCLVNLILYAWLGLVLCLRDSAFSLIQLITIFSFLCLICLLYMLWSPFGSRMDPYPKFGLDVQTDDTIHIPRGYEKLRHLHNMAFWGFKGRLPKLGCKGLERTRKGEWLRVVLIVIRIWGQDECSGEWPGAFLIWIKSQIQKKKGLLSYQLSQMWGMRKT